MNDGSRTDLEESGGPRGERPSGAPPKTDLTGSEVGSRRIWAEAGVYVLVVAAFAVVLVFLQILRGNERLFGPAAAPAAAPQTQPPETDSQLRPPR